jgi:alpha-aminoadipate carrier protein LysW
MVTCPECDTQIDVDEEELDEGDLITCEECGAELKVLGLNPLELEVADEEDEDEEDTSDTDERNDEERWP